MLCCIGLVLGFRHLLHLAAAYGVAITTTMLITTILFYFVARRRWHWPAAAALPVAAFFIIIDLAFFGANMLKVAHGGWFPLARFGASFFFSCLPGEKGVGFFAVTWAIFVFRSMLFLPDLKSQSIRRVPGTAIFMSGNRSGTPLALLHNLKHNKVLHEQVVLLTVQTEEVPYLANIRDRVALEKLEEGFWRAQIHFGFMEKPDVPAALDRVKEAGLRFDARCGQPISLAAKRFSLRASSVFLPGEARSLRG